jgi:integrase
MGLMAKPPKYVHGFIDRHGKPRFYFRRPGLKQIPLPGLPWSPEFMEKYEPALAGAAPIVIGARRTRPGTVADAVARYLGSMTFATLAPTTQKKRRTTLERFRLDHGDKRIGMLRPDHVAGLLRKLRPFAQRNVLKALRALMSFALSDRLIDADPTVGVKLDRTNDTGGFKTWTDDQISIYRNHYPFGTRARLAVELLYGTMQRRGDVIRLGRQHIQHGTISLRQHKTGVPVDIPVLPELDAAIDAMPKAEHLTFLVTEFGKPFTAEGFGNWFRQQCKAAGLPARLSAHGLRKAGATRFAEKGATDHEIMAWGGWTSIREVQRYTRAANRKRLAERAAKKLKGGT